MFPENDTVIVSAGTAITVDCLAGGTRFVGGAIMPGIRMQLHSLASATAQLPALELTPGAPSWCGISTESCIRVGVVRGTAGAVSRLVTDQLAHLASGAHVITTGGAWPVLAEIVDFDHRYIDELTLLGTALYAPEEAR
jgi:type III pantothenate kinase